MSWRPQWWAGFKAWVKSRATNAGQGFNDLHDKIKELGPLTVGVVALLLLVGVTTNDVLPALVRNAPLQMAIVTTLLVGLPLLAIVLQNQYGAPWLLGGTLTVLAICLVIFTAAWSPTAATAPSLSVEENADGDFVVSAGTTRLQNDEALYVHVEGRNESCTTANRPRYGRPEQVRQGSGSLYSGSANGDGTGTASIKHTVDRSLVTSPWLCVWAGTPQRCGWQLPPTLGSHCPVKRAALDSYSFVYLN